MSLSKPDSFSASKRSTVLTKSTWEPRIASSTQRNSARLLNRQPQADKFKLVPGSTSKHPESCTMSETYCSKPGNTVGAWTTVSVASPLSLQNEYFNANCKIRGSFAARSTPKFWLLSVPLGLLKFVWFKTLKNSERTSI